MGTDPTVVALVGCIGVIGTLLGTLVTDRLTRAREERANRARQRRAINAVAGELLDAASVLQKAVERQRWWPPRDAPRDIAWQSYNDDLAEFLSDETWHQLRMTYETFRSFDAQRDEPSRRYFPWEPISRRWSWEARWPHARAAADDCWQATWAALWTLREQYPEVARPADRRHLEDSEEGADP